MRTTAQQDALVAYVEQVRNLMFLQAWELVVKRDPPTSELGDSVLAKVEPVYGRYVATIWVATDFFRQEPALQRMAIVHELVHVAERDVQDTIRVGGVAKALGQAAYDILWANFDREQEQLTDYLTTVIAPSLPLPAFPPAEDAPADEQRPVHDPSSLDRIDTPPVPGGGK